MIIFHVIFKIFFDIFSCIKYQIIPFLMGFHFFIFYVLFLYFYFYFVFLFLFLFCILFFLFFFQLIIMPFWAFSCSKQSGWHKHILTSAFTLIERHSNCFSQLGWILWVMTCFYCQHSWVCLYFVVYHMGTTAVTNVPSTCNIVCNRVCTVICKL